jgi:hypothetical protein
MGLLEKLYTHKHTRLLARARTHTHTKPIYARSLLAAHHQRCMRDHEQDASRQYANVLKSKLRAKSRANLRCHVYTGNPLVLPRDPAEPMSINR